MKSRYLLILLLAAPAHAGGTNLRLVERATSDAVSVHAGGAADHAGDILTFTNDLFDAANATRLGTDQGYCVRMRVGKSWECHLTITLAAGQLSVDGPFFDTADTMMAVTGGTGIYSGARGEMRLHARDAKGSAYDFGFELK